MYVTCMSFNNNNNTNCNIPVLPVLAAPFMFRNDIEHGNLLYARMNTIEDHTNCYSCALGIGKKARF